MKKEVLQCNFCGSTGKKPLYGDDSHLIRCDGCGLVYTRAQMTVDAMKEFYSEGYFTSTNSLNKGYEDYFESRNNINRTFSKRMDLIEAYKPVPGRLLDVGCAAGFFLETARQRGWEVCGVDISSLCASYARDRLGIEVRNDLFVNAGYEKGSFDLVTMWDYLEHSATPKEDIARARELLRDDGLLIIATPDISSVPARLFKSNWIGIKLEEHFYYFSRKVLEGSLVQGGFEVLASSYIGKYVSTAMFADRLVFYNRFAARAFGNIVRRLKFSFYCNPFDIMFIIAKKSPAK